MWKCLIWKQIFIKIALLLLFIGSTLPQAHKETTSSPSSRGEGSPQNNRTVANIRVSNQPIRPAQDSKVAISENKPEPARIRWGHGMIITWVFKFRLLALDGQRYVWPRNAVWRENVSADHRAEEASLRLVAAPSRAWEKHQNRKDNELLKIQKA